MTTALIDGDILLYRIGFSTEEEDEAIALVRMDNYIEEILFNSGASEYKIFLTGDNNFRKDIFPGYKGHRKQAKPKHFNRLKEHLIHVEWAQVSDGQEADDELGIHQTEDTIICSLDKDLMMIPGWHYNFVKNEHYEVTKAEGLRNFYRQLLTGDATDNIPGIFGLGPVKADRLLAGCSEVEEYNRVVWGAYREYFDRCTDKEILFHINLIGRLLWIRRKEDEVWRFELD